MRCQRGDARITRVHRRQMERKMTHALLRAVGLAALIAATGAHAADMRRPMAQPYTVNAPLNAYSWAGPYLGANLGYQWGRITNDPTRPSGLLGGVQGGYNWQSGAFVFGGEADIQLTGAEDVFAPWKFTNPWFGTARARIGYAMNNLLFYGTGGLAIGSVRAETFGLTESKTALGWTVGIGAEYGITQNWSAKAEYLYVDLSDRAYSITGASNGYEYNILRLGVNYHF
jgi:outer membrane immunogenic protein